MAETPGPRRRVFIHLPVPQEAPDRRPMASRNEVRHRPAVAGREHEQVGVEPVPHPRRLADEILARLEEEMQFAGPIGDPDRWQVRLPSGDSRDRERVARVALARPAGPPAFNPPRTMTSLRRRPSPRARSRGPRR